MSSRADRQSWYHGRTSSDTHTYRTSGLSAVREELTLDVLVERWGVSDRELAACRKAAREMSGGAGRDRVNVLDVVSRNLWSAGWPEGTTRRQDRRLDKLAYIVRRIFDRGAP